MSASTPAPSLPRLSSAHPVCEEFPFQVWDFIDNILPEEKAGIGKIQNFMKDVFRALQPSMEAIFASSRCSGSKLLTSENRVEERSIKYAASLEKYAFKALAKLQDFEVEVSWAEAQKTKQKGIYDIQEVLRKIESWKEEPPSHLKKAPPINPSEQREIIL